MTIRLNKVTRDLNVGITTVVEFLQKKGFTVEANPNTKITEEQYAVLVKEFSKDKDLRIESLKKFFRNGRIRTVTKLLFRLKTYNRRQSHSRQNRRWLTL